MRQFRLRSKCAPAVVAFCATLALCCSSAAAYQATSPTRTIRGGILAQASQHEFEAFFYPTGLRLFVYDAAGRPVASNQPTGTVTFYHPNSPSPWFTRSLHGGNGSLDLSVNLLGLPGSGVTARFQLKGLNGPGGAEAAFTVPVQFVAQSISGTASTVTRTASYGPPASSVPGTSLAPVATEPSYYAAPIFPYTAAPVHTFAPVVPWTDYEPHYHIRDWTTGIEKPSYEVSKPWLDVRQYP